MADGTIGRYYAAEKQPKIQTKFSDYERNLNQCRLLAVVSGQRTEKAVNDSQVQLCHYGFSQAQ